MAVEKHIPEAAATTSYIQYKGVWDMQDLYEFLAGFFSSRKFKFYELRYITKFPGPFGPETYYVWQAKRDNDEYTKNIVDIFLHTYDTQDIEVTMKDGSKRTFSKGRMWVQLKARVEFDYEKRWDESAFYANLRNFYHKYVIFKKIGAVYWDSLQYTVFYKLHSLIKERLKMESDSYEHRYFHKVR